MDSHSWEQSLSGGVICRHAGNINLVNITLETSQLPVPNSYPVPNKAQILCTTVLGSLLYERPIAGEGL